MKIRWKHLSGVRPIPHSVKMFLDCEGHVYRGYYDPLDGYFEIKGWTGTNIVAYSEDSYMMYLTVKCMRGLK